MRVSVALCTYNGERHLQSQLNSVIRQTRCPDEMIICDDCSTDATRHILSRFANEAQFEVRLHLNDRNIGSNANFEKAISLCTGGVVFLSDQDDVWEPEKIETMLEALRVTNADMVFSDGLVIDEGAKSLRYSLWAAFGFSKRLRKQWISGKAFDIELRSNVVTGAAMAFRAEVKELVLPLGKGLCHDAWIAALTSAYLNTSWVDGKLIKYRQHGANQLGATRRTSAFRFMRARKARLRKLLDERAGWGGIRDRLAELDVCNESIAKVDRKIAHLDRRIAILHSRRVRRFVPTAREALSRGYHRYSNGVVSAILDVIA